MAKKGQFWGALETPGTIFDGSKGVELVPPYGSVSAGREKWPFNVLFFFLKVEPPCDQT